ncbi:MAG: cytidine deaminase [Desulfobaccales bacterium]
MNPSPLSEKERTLLLGQAREALSRAYAPYSGLRVGAAALTQAGQIYVGVNVENASYGLTLCAERTAICAAVTREGPEMLLKALAVVSDQPGPCPPCGACRQVIFEFGPDATVIFQGPDGLEEEPIARLLPGAFRLR